MNARPEPEFRTRLREIRERVGVSQRELARRAGISPTYLQQLEAGHAKRGGVEKPVDNPSRPMVKAIVDALDALTDGPTPAEQRELYELAGYPVPAQKTTAALEGDGRSPEDARKQHPFADLTLEQIQRLTWDDIARMLEEATGFGVHIRDARDRAPARPGRHPAQKKRGEDRS